MASHETLYKLFHPSLRRAQHERYMQYIFDFALNVLLYSNVYFIAMLKSEIMCGMKKNRITKRKIQIERQIHDIAK